MKSFFVVVSLGIFVFLVLQVKDKANPWERVLVIDNGLEGDNYGSSTLSDRNVCCFSKDESVLYVAMPNGLIEVWDLEKLEKLNSFGIVLDADEVDKERRHLDGAWNLELNDAGELVESRWGKLIKHSEAGELIAEYSMDEFHRKYFVSPDGKWVASSWVGSGPGLINLDTKEKISIEPQQGLNGSMDTRLQWTKDGEGLLFSELLVFSLTDLQSGKTKFINRELNLDLPYPHLPSEVLEEGIRRKSGAMLVDSQLADGDSKVVSIYGSYFGGGIDQDKFILRFYSAEDGEVLKSVSLPYEPRNLWVSEDGSLAYITMCPDMNTMLLVYDTKTMEQLTETESKMTNIHPARAIGLLNEKSVLHFNGGSYMQHWDDEYAAFRLDALGEHVIQALSNKHADLIVTALNSRDIHVWKKRREPSKWGAYAVWEYGASYLLLAALMVVMVGWICAKTVQNKGRSFTRLEWVVMVVSAILISISIADMIYKPVLGDLWVLRPKGVTFFGMLGCVLSLAGLIGLSRQNDGWRKFVRLMSLLGGLVILGYTVYIWIIFNRAEIGWDTMIPLTNVNGLQLEYSFLSWSCILVIFTSYLFFKCWVFRRAFHSDLEEKS